MMKKNSMTLLGAAILASGIFYVINNPESFTASILSLQEQNFITKQGRDIAYKTDNGYVDIFLGTDREIPQSIQFIISFDQDTITIDPQNMSGQGTRTMNNPDKYNTKIQWIPSQIVDKNQSIFMVPFSGEQTDILLSEAVAITREGKQKSLSIGSLNQTNNHTQK